MRRHGSLAWLLVSSLTLALGCGSSSEKTAPDGATDAAFDRAPGAADRAPDATTVEHAPDTTVADLAPESAFRTVAPRRDLSAEQPADPSR